MRCVNPGRWVGQTKRNIENVLGLRGNYLRMAVHRTEYKGICSKCEQEVEVIEDRCVTLSLFLLIPHLNQKEEICEGSESRWGETGFNMPMGHWGGQGI